MTAQSDVHHPIPAGIDHVIDDAPASNAGRGGVERPASGERGMDSGAYASAGQSAETRTGSGFPPNSGWW